MNATELIARSIRHVEITHAPFADELAAALAAEADEEVHHSGVTEYWGTTEAGDDWRVHLDHDRE